MISCFVMLFPTVTNYKLSFMFIRDKIGNYARTVPMLLKQLMEAVLESLGLECGYLQEEIEEGSQVMAINCYPACPEPDLVLGIPPHSDYGTLTILFQSCPGLQIMDQKNNWLSFPAIEGALVVQLGNQVEVMSNRHYKSVVHQVTLSTENKQHSIASIDSLALNKKIASAEELVDEQQPASYKGFSFGDFLDLISSNNIADIKFIDSLRKTT